MLEWRVAARAEHEQIQLGGRRRELRGGPAAEHGCLCIGHPNAGESLLEPCVRLLHLRPPALRKAEAPGDDGERLQIGAGGAREIGGGVKSGDGFRGLVQPAAHPLQPDRRAPVQPAGCHDDRAGAGVQQPLPRGAEEHGRHRVEVRWTGDHEADLLRRRELVQAGGRVLCRERIESHPHAGGERGRHAPARRACPRNPSGV